MFEVLNERDTLTVPRVPDKINTTPHRIAHERTRKSFRSQAANAIRFHAASAPASAIYAATSSSGTGAAAGRGNATTACLRSEPERRAAAEEKLDALDPRWLRMFNPAPPHRGGDRIQCVSRPRESQ